MKEFLHSTCWLLLTAFFVICCDESADSGSKASKPEIIEVVPDHGEKGTEVRIKGKNFKGSAQDIVVSFNGVHADIIEASASELVTRVPVAAESGVLDVYVNNVKATGPFFTVDPTEMVTTFAGSTAGLKDGSASVAQFNDLGFVVVDKAGNVYVADGYNALIRKINTAGEVSTLAGGEKGFADGTGTAAKFRRPTGIAIGPDGNLYVADKGNHAIRKITPEGVVTTVAGKGDTGWGYVNGDAAQAKFNEPYGVTLDAAGNIYVADAYNFRIRKITPQGVVSTFAGQSTSGTGNGTGELASFTLPTGIAADASGNLYVVDNGAHMIRKITPAALVTTLAGDGSSGHVDGDKSSAKFNNPMGIAIDKNGALYIADTWSHCIRKHSSGITTTIAGTTLEGFVDGPANSAQFRFPVGISINEENEIFIADTGNHVIRKIAVE